MGAGQTDVKLGAKQYIQQKEAGKITDTLFTKQICFLCKKYLQIQKLHISPHFGKYLIDKRYADNPTVWLQSVRGDFDLVEIPAMQNQQAPGLGSKENLGLIQGTQVGAQGQNGAGFKVAKKIDDVRAWDSQMYLKAKKFLEVHNPVVTPPHLFNREMYRMAVAYVNVNSSESDTGCIYTGIKQIPSGGQKIVQDAYSLELKMAEIECFNQATQNARGNFRAIQPARPTVVIEAIEISPSTESPTGEKKPKPQPGRPGYYVKP